MRVLSILTSNSWQEIEKGQERQTIPPNITKPLQKCADTRSLCGVISVALGAASDRAAPHPSRLVSASPQLRLRSENGAQHG